MTAPGHLHRVRVASVRSSDGVGRHRSRRVAPGRTGRLPHGVGESLKIVTAGPGGPGIDGQPYDFPAARGSQPLGVLGTQVVTVRLRVGGERPENGGRIRVDVRERRDSGTAACGARTATYRAHDVGPYRTLERPATTLLEVTPSCRPDTPETSDLRKSESADSRTAGGSRPTNGKRSGVGPKPHFGSRSAVAMHLENALKHDVTDHRGTQTRNFRC
jgi:hypothetical protein